MTDGLLDHRFTLPTHDVAYAKCVLRLSGLPDPDGEFSKSVLRGELRMKPRQPESGRQSRNTVGRSLIGIAALLVVVGGTYAEEKPPPEGKLVSVNNFEMHCEKCGQGNPLLLLHGSTASGASWRPHTAEPAKHYELIIPDLRGHGRSTNPTGKLLIARQRSMSLHSWTH